MYTFLQQRSIWSTYDIPENDSGGQKHQRPSVLHSKEPADWLRRGINKQRIILKYNKAIIEPGMDFVGIKMVGQHIRQEQRRGTWR